MKTKKRIDPIMIKEAINKTSDSNAKSFNYMNKILTDWKSKGYKTLGDVQNEIKPIKKSAKQIKQENEYTNKKHTMANLPSTRG